MSFTLTVTAEDWTATGASPSTGFLEIGLLRPVLGDTITTDKTWEARLLADGTGTWEIPTVPADNALKVRSRVAGLYAGKTFYFANPGVAAHSLTELIEDWQVNPATLEPTEEVLAGWDLALADRPTRAEVSAMTVPALDALELLPCLLYGDSYSAADFANTPGARWVARLVRRTGMNLANRSASGDTVEDTTERATAGANPIPEGTAGVIVNQAGENNLAYGDSALTRTSHLLALRAFVGLATALDRIEVEGDGVVRSGDWEEQTWAPEESSASFLMSTSSFAAYLDVPIAEAGDYIVHVHGTDGTWQTADVKISQGGTTLATLDTNLTHQPTQNIASQNFGLKGIYVPGVAAGTLRIQRATDNGRNLLVDLVTRINRETPPLVVLTKPPLTPAHAAAATLHAALRANVDTVAAEFPEAIIVVDLDAGWDSGTMTGPDGLHPNDHGSAFIAGKYVDALRTVQGRPGIWRRTA